MATTTKVKVTSRHKKPRRVVERNVALTGSFMRYLMAQPRILESLPDKFELVILPEDDPELRRYNLDLLDAYGSEGRPIVFVRLKSSQETDFKAVQPQVYAPIAA
jgi:hypothetical protein